MSRCRDLEQIPIKPVFFNVLFLFAFPWQCGKGICQVLTEAPVMPMPAAAAAALRRSSCRVAHLQASTLPLVRGVAACGHKLPTILVSKFVHCADLICTPHFPTFVLDGRLQNFRTNSDETLQQEFSSEDLCIWRAQNCRVLLLDTRLAALLQRVEFTTALREVREKTLKRKSRIPRPL